MSNRSIYDRAGVSLIAVIVFAGACTARRGFQPKEWHRSTLLAAPTTYRDATRGLIHADRYFSHIQLLAHDDLKGRGTGSDGIDLAAGYIAGHFAAAGVRPGGPNGTYFQEFSITGWNFLSKSDDTAARNVVGLLPGTGEHANEFVILGAHYDHLGVRKGAIYNGADDNASGAAGLVELAYLLSATPIRDRSVIFVAFTGEEIGLKGSGYFVEHPTVSAAKITAMINMDMIGRMNPDNENNRLGIHGLGTGGAFHEIVERRAAEMNLPYIPDESALGPSDHISFYLAGIPSLFFFTGVHSDYHRPSDDAEKINVDGAVRVAELVSRIALDLVNAEESPVFAKVDAPSRIFRSANTGPRAVLGVALSMDDASETPGVLIEQVSPNSGAARADLRPGDRLIRVDGQSVAGPMELRSALSPKKPGDRVRIGFLRDAEELGVEVELLSPEGLGGASPP